MSAREKLSKARAALLLDSPFFGVLAMRLAPVEDRRCKTLWTDGRSLGFNPDFVNGLSPSRLKAALAHEVLHCAAGHPWRRGSRDARTWNEAADHAVNLVLKDAGFDLDPDWLMDSAFRGLSAEEIYARIAPPAGRGAGQGSGRKADSGQDAGGNGNDSGQDEGSGADGGQGADEADFGPGEVRDAPVETASQDEARWRVAAAKAAKAAKAAGKLPAWLERFVEEAVRPRADWRAILRRFVSSASREDYDWRLPSPRYLAAGLYLPRLKSEGLGPVAVFVDTSGSIGEAELSAFAAEIRSIAEEARPETLWVVYADAEVHRADEFPKGEEVEIRPIGGGGTDFRPAFDWVEAQRLEPACAIYLTDLMGSFPERPPDYPVLWVSTLEGEAPWGETARLEL